MGANESADMRVNFDRSNLFYLSGDQISGNILFDNTRDKLTLDEVFLEFVGEFGYTTQETRRRDDGNGNTHTESYTEHHRIPFITNRIRVVQPQYGQCELILYRGQYTWPFEFVLPQCLPPSSIPSPLVYPYVKYFARIVLDKPWYKPNAEQIHNLIIFPRVNLYHIANAQQPVAFSHLNRKKVALQGYLVQGGVVPGDRLVIHIDLLNPKRTEIKRVEATLYQYREIARTQHVETIFRTDLPSLREFRENEFHDTFNLSIPAVQLAPTYTYIPQCRGRSVVISYRYELKLEVKARGLFTDFKVIVPVVIGTEPVGEQNYPTNNFIDTVMPSAPVYEHDEPPPSYESVVGEEKQ